MSEYLYDIKEVITRDANARAIYELGRRHATEDAIRKQTDAVTLAIERAAKTLAAAIINHENCHERYRSQPTTKSDWSNITPDDMRDDATRHAEKLWNATAKEQEQ